MTPEQIKDILDQHKLWLTRSGGACANLTGANLTGANLHRADLHRADLTGADLTGANLRGANLRGADLSGANLRGADLSGVNLRGADLSGANLRGANLFSADLTGAHFDSTIGVLYAAVCFAGLGAESRQWSAVKLDGEWRCFCGCFIGTLEELAARVAQDKTHVKLRRSRLEAFSILKKMCKLADHAAES